MGEIHDAILRPIGQLGLTRLVARKPWEGKCRIVTNAFSIQLDCKQLSWMTFATK